jgi:hypothetical protein
LHLARQLRALPIQLAEVWCIALHRIEGMLQVFPDHRFLDLHLGHHRAAMLVDQARHLIEDGMQPIERALLGRLEAVARE